MINDKYMPVQNQFRGCSFLKKYLNHTKTPQHKSYISLYTPLLDSDSSLAIFGHDKLQLFKKLEQSPEKQRLADIISTISSTKKQLGTTGNLTVDLLRNRPFQTMVAGCNKLEPEWLPPTNIAAHFHASSYPNSTMDIVGRRRPKPHWIPVRNCRLIEESRINDATWRLLRPQTLAHFE